jgi:hypothetical protein
MSKPIAEADVLYVTDEPFLNDEDRWSSKEWLRATFNMGIVAVAVAFCGALYFLAP